MTSTNMRNNPLFMRNSYTGRGKWNIPLVRKQNWAPGKLRLLACSETRSRDSLQNREKGVHFFVDDYRFTGIYANPQRSLKKYSQYKFLLTPDDSLYADMDLWRQLESVAHSRWVGAFWQEHGLTVIPTVSWSTAASFDFCFDGLETGGAVAVGMVGCKHSRMSFLRGYDAMLERLSPEIILCYGEPFPEMRGNLLVADYRPFQAKEAV